MGIIEKCALLVRTCLSYLLVGCVILFTIVPLTIIFLLCPQRWTQESRVVYWLLDKFYKGCIAASLLACTIEGKKNIPCEPAVFVANHQSVIDIPLLGSLVDGYPHLWYAFVLFAKVPVLGFFVRHLGVPADTDDASNAASTLLRSIKLLQRQKKHFMIFPEGSRFNDGHTHEFLRGFAVVARATGRPVVPVYMPYNGIVYPPHSFYAYWHPLVIVIGTPFFLEKDESDAAFVKRVYAWFVAYDKKYR